MVDPDEVHALLRQHMLADGFSMVLDLERSHGSWLVDARTGEAHLDFFTCFASWPIGYNHPMTQDPEFLEELQQAALTKPSNSDLYTSHMADFVEAFATRVTPPEYVHHFWVSGGALAVENALKVAFDWKARRRGLAPHDAEVDRMAVAHFRQAFHGRSGYTMSLTNTDPTKVDYFPKFRWPRIHNPAVEFDLDGRVVGDIEAEERRAVAELQAAFREHPDRIACIIIEPMQAEGGDNHFRPEFLLRLRELADEHEALLVFDEVQTGFYGSGAPWLWQKLGVPPDVVAFGKKTQVCGIYAGQRVDEVADNVFRVPSRINSTWGGNLVDMVRARRFIEIIQVERLDENIRRQGERLLAGLREIGRTHPGLHNIRGVGSLLAFTLPDPTRRDRVLRELSNRRLLALPCGQRSVRFRLPLCVRREEIDEGLQRTQDAVTAAGV
jgi:L-lysine 6-transaminase